MKQSIRLESPELANLFSEKGFTLYLRDGQDITLFAHRQDVPGFNGKAATAGEKYPEPTCEKCGCTEGAACPGGCEWIRLDQQTNAGLCSACADQTRPAREPRRLGKKRRQGRAKKGTRAERSAAKKEIFFQVLKETDDIKRAAKKAHVTTSMGYRWRAMAGAPSEVHADNGHKRKPRRKIHPHRRDFNRPNNLNFWCRPCGLGFPSKESLERHQQDKHGIIIRTPAPGVAV